MSDSFRRVFSAYVERCGRNGIFLDVKAADPELPLGCSKIGGCPDLPPATVWPSCPDAGGRAFPHAFFAQLNLAEFAAEDAAHELPPTGLLSFFAEMDANGGGWDGSSPADWGRWRVLYTEAGAELEPRPLPAGLDSYWKLPERAIVATPSRLFPPDLAYVEEESAAFEPFVEACQGEEEIAGEAYLACRSACLGRKSAYERRPLLLGHPDIEQQPMEPLCEAASRRHEQGVQGEQTCNPEDAEGMERRRGDWLLLFQYSNARDEENREFIFGDFPGNIYFWIRRQDLAIPPRCQVQEPQFGKNTK